MNNFIINDVVRHGHTTGSLELNQAGEKLFGKLWDGALGRNEVRQRYRGGVALVNMDKKQYGQPSGTHWVCLVKGHYYDPLMPNGKKWTLNKPITSRTVASVAWPLLCSICKILLWLNSCRRSPGRRPNSYGGIVSKPSMF